VLQDILKCMKGDVPTVEADSEEDYEELEEMLVKFIEENSITKS